MMQTNMLLRPPQVELYKHWQIAGVVWHHRMALPEVRGAIGPTTLRHRCVLSRMSSGRRSDMHAHARAQLRQH